MRNLRIGIMGCLLNCSNLGCVALSYSLLQVLEDIARRENAKFEYIIFDEKPSQKVINQTAEKLNIDARRIGLGTCGALQKHNLKSFIRANTKMLVANRKMCSDIRQCDVIIDMTGGDSFSDIYGKERFYRLSAVKKRVEDMGVPLILGPQTYGPFNDEKVKKYAKRVIDKATLVMARDNESVVYLNDFCEAKLVSVTDIAFSLAYSSTRIEPKEKIRIGINPSGLLGKNKNEQTVLNNNLKTDYDQYIVKLTEKLSSDDRYELYYISHVGNEATDCFQRMPAVQYHPPFSDPIEAKSFISDMDIFIGSRMHATIGAFSSGVATIPVAYSKKFFGLFSAIEYKNVVDLQKLSTDEAVAQTLAYIRDYKKLKESIEKSDCIVKEKYSLMIKALTECLDNI